MRCPASASALPLAVPLFVAFALGAVGPVSAQVGDRCDVPQQIHTLPFVVVDSTTRYLDDLRPLPGRCGPPDPNFGVGPDAVYMYQSMAAQPESVVFQVEPLSGWDPCLYVLFQDCAFGPCIAASNQGGPGQPESFTIEVQPLIPYFVVVDGVGGSAGPYACAAHFSYDTLCNNIAHTPLALARNDKVGSGIRRLTWRATTSPTHMIFAPTPCRREYRVPWPRADAAGNALWAAFARSGVLGSNLGYVVPSSATARVQFTGSYTLHCKPVDAGSVLCTASFTLNGRHVVHTEKPAGLAVSYLGTRVLFQPFFNPVWPALTRDCISVPADAEDECAEYEAWNVGPVVKPEFVPCNRQMFVDFLLEASVSTWGRALARAQNHHLDLDLVCPTCFPTDHAPAGGVEASHVTFDMQEMRITRTTPVQPQAITVPAGFSATFVEVDSSQAPAALDRGDGHGFGDDLYLTHSVTALPEFPDSTPPDTSQILTYGGGPLAVFPSAELHAPSDLRFDLIGNFGFLLHATSADDFDSFTGEPLLGRGTVVAIDPGGTTQTIASGLHAPSALAFAGGTPWDGSLYVTEILEGKVLRIRTDATVETFATGLTLPSDLEFAYGAFGGDLYVLEADSLYPDSIPHAAAGRLARYSSGGVRSPFVSGLHLPTSLASTSGALFCDNLYVALGNELGGDNVPIPGTGRIVRVDAAGDVTPFAEGLEQPMRLVFDPAGELDVAVAGGFVRITSDLVGVRGPRGQAALRLDAAPNPFATSTRVSLEVSRSGRYRLEVFNPSGQRMGVVADRSFDAGRHTLSWDGKDADARELPSGVYWLRLRGPDGSSVSRRVAIFN